MQKEKGIKPATERAKKFLRPRPLACPKTPFWNVGQTLHSSEIIPKGIYSIVLYSINIVVGIIFSSRY